MTDGGDDCVQQDWGDLSEHTGSLRRLERKGHPAFKASELDNTVTGGVRSIADESFKELCGLLLHASYAADRSKDWLEWTSFNGKSPRSMKATFLRDLETWSHQLESSAKGSPLNSGLGKPTSRTRRDYDKAEKEVCGEFGISAAITVSRCLSRPGDQVVPGQAGSLGEAFSFWSCTMAIVRNTLATDGRLWRWATQTGDRLDQMALEMGRRDPEQLQDLRQWARDSVTTAKRLAGSAKSAIAGPAGMPSLAHDIESATPLVGHPIGSSGLMSIPRSEHESRISPAGGGTWPDGTLANPWASVYDIWHRATIILRCLRESRASLVDRHVPHIERALAAVETDALRVIRRADELEEEWNLLTGQQQTTP